MQTSYWAGVTEIGIMDKVNSAIIFLDIDGVLNDHKRLDNSHYGFKPECVTALNLILDQVPHALIVISSSWRYLVHSGAMTVKGFECLLLSHGIDCRDRVIAVTRKDDLVPPTGLEPHMTQEWWERSSKLERAFQIHDYLKSWWISQGQTSSHFVVLDDLDLPIENLIRTDSNCGLTNDLSEEAIHLLSYGSKISSKETGESNSIPTVYGYQNGYWVDAEKNLSKLDSVVGSFDGVAMFQVNGCWKFKWYMALNLDLLKSAISNISRLKDENGEPYFPNGANFEWVDDPSKHPIIKESYK